MDFLKYMRAKKHTEAKKAKEPSVDEVISSTMAYLEEYANNVEAGKVHDFNRFSEGSVQRDKAMTMSDTEVFAVRNAISALSDAKKIIAKGRVADDVFHYDTDGRCDEI